MMSRDALLQRLIAELASVGLEFKAEFAAGELDPEIMSEIGLADSESVWFWENRKSGRLFKVEPDLILEFGHPEAIEDFIALSVQSARESVCH